MNFLHPTKVKILAVIVISLAEILGGWILTVIATTWKWLFSSTVGLLVITPVVQLMILYVAICWVVYKGTGPTT